MPDGCELRDFNVSLQSLGLNLILAPKAVNIFQCVGKCKYPFQKDVNRTNHGYLIGAAHTLSPDRHPPPCCRPSKLGDLEVLVMKEGVLYTMIMDRAVAEECACQ